MICDAHNHLLYGMDSGAATLDQSATMVKALISQGITSLILSPHYKPSEQISRFILRRDLALSELKRHLGCEKKHILLVPSAEVQLTDSLIEHPDLDKLVIPGTPYLPCALPLDTFPGAMVKGIVYLIQKRRIYPYFLHIERYITFYSKEDLQRLFSFHNCLWGVTVRALIDDRVSHEVMRLLLGGKTILPSTNAHDLSFRPPETRLEYLNLAGVYGEKVYLQLLKQEKSFIQPLYRLWRRRGY